MFLGIGLRPAGMLGSASFSPAALFASGEEGAWYDPSDLSTLFQDSAGTTPVTTAGQPVGLMLDKSGRGNHATQATSAARPTYQHTWDGIGPLGPELITNGTFGSFADWTDVSSGAASSGAAGGYLQLNNTVDDAAVAVTQLEAVISANSSWILSFDVISSTVHGTDLRVGVSNTEITSDGDGTQVYDVTRVANVTGTTVSLVLTAAFDINYIRISTNGSSSTVEVDNVSVKEIPVGSRLHWLAFDGVDDVLRVDGTSSKDWTIAAGITPLAAAIAGPMYSANTLGSNRFILYPNDTAVSSGGLRLFMNSGNLINEAGPDLTGAAVVYAIRSVTLDHSARRNGVSVGTSTSSQDANFLPASIGSYSTQFGESKIFGLVVVEGAVDTLAELEQYLATKSGVTL